jgi:CelD/BcsL family acetyltransferase involved in cellulose biosynthesis
MVEWIKDESGWDAFAPAWDRLLPQAAEQFPFLQSGMLRAWWRHRGGGEWPAESELRLLVDRDGDRVRGIAPLFRTPDGTYRLVGSLEIMDYLGCVYAGDQSREFSKVVCAGLADASKEEWNRIILSNLHPSSPILPLLEEEAKRQGWQTTVSELQECPLITLPGSWDEYLGELDKKQRHEIRRKLRRAESEYQLEVRIASGENLPQDVGEFLALMETDPRKAAFLTPQMRNQFQDLALSAKQVGMLELAFLVVDGAIAAAFYNFDYLQRTWVYNSGMNPKFASISPGWVLLAKLIQRSIERKQTAFDFMRGNEDYKFHWGGKSTKLAQISILRG